MNKKATNEFRKSGKSFAVVLLFAFLIFTNIKLSVKHNGKTLRVKSFDIEISFMDNTFAKRKKDKLGLIWCISQTGDSFYACELNVSNYECGWPRICL